MCVGPDRHRAGGCRVARHTLETRDRARVSSQLYGRCMAVCDCEVWGGRERRAGDARLELGGSVQGLFARPEVK